MPNARTIKIPDGNGNLVSYPIEDVRNKRTRRNISSDLTNLPTAIAEQNLEKYGYKIGYYFDGPTSQVDGENKTYRYTIADKDTFYGGYTSYSVIGTHHITLVVDTNTNVKWNETDVTTGGYVASNLHTYLVNKVLPKVKSDITSLFGDWNAHLLKHSKLFSTGDSAWAWSNDVYISALTSVQLHGSPICDMNFYHTGEGNKPLEVFQDYFYPEILGNQANWERSVASAGHPCAAGSYGSASGGNGASDSYGAVGLIIFI